MEDTPAPMMGMDILGGNEKKLTPQATRRRTGTQLSPSVAAMVAGIPRVKSDLK